MAEIIAIQPEISAKTEAKRTVILEAAQSVFMRKGFELATMQDVAAACGMSAGNIYRYFASKADIVSGLVERDRNELAQQFVALSKSPDQLEGFEKLGRAHLRESVTRKASLTLEIWAAASRTPELKAMCVKMETAVVENMRVFVDQARKQGGVAEGVDPDLVTHLVMALVQNMFHDAALKSNHDLEHSLDILFATVRAALAGKIQLQNSRNT